MNEDRIKILEMLKQGKLTVDEADELLSALQEHAGTRDQAPASEVPAVPRNKPKYLRVVVDDKGDHVDIRVPLGLIRAGIKLSSFIPQDMQNKLQSSLSEKGISFDLSNINPETVEDLIDSLAELDVNVQEKEGQGTVRIFCE